jgi:hypothetical protein
MDQVGSKSVMVCNYTTIIAQLYGNEEPHTETLTDRWFTPHRPVRGEQDALLKMSPRFI